MRVLATAMLAGMAAVFVAASGLQDAHPFWGFVRAFAEAAMVGGIADWFAVTALFRHPLGLPIPHTAIIPRNKDRIGETLAQFLKANFLTPSVVSRRMRTVNVAGALGRFLASPPRGGRLREGASRLGADILQALDEERLGGMVKGAVAARMRAWELSPVVGRSLEAAIGEDRHVPMLDAIVTWAGRTLDSNEDLIRAMVKERAGWVVKLAGLEEKLADKIVEGLRRLTIDMAMDETHPLRTKTEEGLVRLAAALQDDPDTRAKVEAWKNELIANKAVAEWVEGLWEAARGGLLRAARHPDKALAGRFGEAMRQLGDTLQQEPELRRAINRFSRRVAVGIVGSYGNGIVALVSETVHRWDARTVTYRVEAAVGRDLQYIRINGTIVGGLVGLLIHTAEVLA